MSENTRETGPGGAERTTSGTFLDTCALGVIVASGGARLCVSWESLSKSLSTVELAE